jgi:hypothetical protein
MRKVEVLGEYMGKEDVVVIELLEVKDYVVLLFDIIDGSIELMRGESIDYFIELGVKCKVWEYRDGKCFMIEKGEDEWYNFMEESSKDIEMARLDVC